MKLPTNLAVGLYSFNYLEPVKPYLFFFLVLLTAWHPAAAQNIASHQWEDRVLIVMTRDVSDAEFMRQVQELKDNLEGFSERNVTVYLATPDDYKILNTLETGWKSGGELYNTYILRNAVPEVLLIGLDGHIKHRKYSFTSAFELFVIIDGMPMRQSEMKNRKIKNKNK